MARALELLGLLAALAGGSKLTVTPGETVGRARLLVLDRLDLLDRGAPLALQLHSTCGMPTLSNTALFQPVGRPASRK